MFGIAFAKCRDVLLDLPRAHLVQLIHADAGQRFDVPFQIPSVCFEGVNRQSSFHRQVVEVAV